MLKYSAEFVPVLQAEDAEVSGPDPQTDGSDDEVISEDEDAVDTTTVGADDAKSIAALVAYMVGGATTDGAILHLMEKLIGADNNGVAEVKIESPPTGATPIASACFRALPLLKKPTSAFSH